MPFDFGLSEVHSIPESSSFTVIVLGHPPIFFNCTTLFLKVMGGYILRTNGYSKSMTRTPPAIATNTNDIYEILRGKKYTTAVNPYAKASNSCYLAVRELR